MRTRNKKKEMEEDEEEERSEKPSTAAMISRTWRGASVYP